MSTNEVLLNIKFSELGCEKDWLSPTQFPYFVCPIEFNPELERMTMMCEPSALFRYVPESSGTNRQFFLTDKDHYRFWKICVSDQGLSFLRGCESALLQCGSGSMFSQCGSESDFSIYCGSGSSTKWCESSTYGLKTLQATGLHFEPSCHHLSLHGPHGFILGL